jgi:hypothetical protein
MYNSLMLNLVVSKVTDRLYKVFNVAIKPTANENFTR